MYLFCGTILHIPPDSSCAGQKLEQLDPTELRDPVPTGEVGVSCDTFLPFRAVVHVPCLCENTVDAFCVPTINKTLNSKR